MRYIYKWVLNVWEFIFHGLGTALRFSVFFPLGLYLLVR